MNPVKLMQMKSMFEKFKISHPKIPAFFNDAVNSLQVGSIIEMKVTAPDGRTLCANMRVNADDMELLRQANELGK